MPCNQDDRRHGKRVYLLCRQARKSRASSYCVGLFAMRSTCQELNNVNRRPLAPMRVSLFRMQSRRRRWRCVQPDNAARPSGARCHPRRNGSARRKPTPDCPGHAAPGKLCKFAQNRAVQALQIRPISTTRDALQELQAAISNGLAAFQSTADNAAQGIPDRPPGVDTLRLCAVGVEFS